MLETIHWPRKVSRVKYLSQTSSLNTYTNKVCLLVIMSTKYLKMYEWIYMILAGQVGLEPKNNWLHFGSAPDLGFQPLDSYCF